MFRNHHSFGMNKTLLAFILMSKMLKLYTSICIPDFFLYMRIISANICACHITKQFPSNRLIYFLLYNMNQLSHWTPVASLSLLPWQKCGCPQGLESNDLLTLITKDNSGQVFPFLSYQLHILNWLIQSS